MELDLGGSEVISNPTDEDITRYLKLVHAENPFVILSDDNGFIQALFHRGEYQIEYSLDNGYHQYQHFGDYEVACQLLIDYLHGGTEYQTRVTWKRIHIPGG